MPRVRQLAFATLQSAFDFSQRMRPAKLAEQHADGPRPAPELAPTRQSLAAVLRPGFFYHPLEVGTRDELEYLTEHAA